AVVLADVEEAGGLHRVEPGVGALRRLGFARVDQDKVGQPRPCRRRDGGRDGWTAVAAADAELPVDLPGDGGGPAGLVRFGDVEHEVVPALEVGKPLGRSARGLSADDGDRVPEAADPAGDPLHEGAQTPDVADGGEAE